MRFRSVVELHGKTATGIKVPDEVVSGLGSGKRPAVHATLNGYTYRTTVAPMGGVFLIPVSADVRQKAQVNAGDEVDVELVLDTEPREVAIPPGLASALAADAKASQAFNALSFSKKQRLVLPIEQAKTGETRQKRIDKALSELKAG